MLRSIWDLPRPGFEPVSPALAGGFLTPAPPGKSEKHFLIKQGSCTGGGWRVESMNFCHCAPQLLSPASIRLGLSLASTPLLVGNASSHPPSGGQSVEQAFSQAASRLPWRRKASQGFHSTRTGVYLSVPLSFHSYTIYLRI